MAAKVNELLHRRYAQETIEVEVLDFKAFVEHVVWTKTIGIQKEAFEYLLLPFYALVMTVTAFVRANFHAKRGNMTVFGQIYLGLYFLCKFMPL